MVGRNRWARPKQATAGPAVPPNPPRYDPCPRAIGKKLRMQHAGERLVGGDAPVANATEHPRRDHRRAILAQHRHEPVGGQLLVRRERGLGRNARDHHALHRPGEQFLRGRRGVPAQAAERGGEIFGRGPVAKVLEGGVGAGDDAVGRGRDDADGLRAREPFAESREPGFVVRDDALRARRGLGTEQGGETAQVGMRVVEGLVAVEDQHGHAGATHLLDQLGPAVVGEKRERGAKTQDRLRVAQRDLRIRRGLARHAGKLGIAREVRERRDLLRRGDREQELVAPHRLRNHADGLGGADTRDEAEEAGEEQTHGRH